jgi:hypothetical protein
LILLFGSCSSPPSKEALLEESVPAYTQEEIAYFTEIAFGSEFGYRDDAIRKWTSEIRLQVFDAPTPEDTALIRQVVEEINVLARQPLVRLVGEDPTVEMRFVAQDRLDARVPGGCRCVGLAQLRDNARREIRSADILVLATLPPARRRHVIREEITQATGLLMDSHSYPSSLFYQDYSEVQEFAEIDRKLIEMLYRPEVRPGMTRAQVVQTLREL